MTTANPDLPDSRLTELEGLLTKIESYYVIDEGGYEAGTEPVLAVPAFVIQERIDTIKRGEA